MSTSETITKNDLKNILDKLFPLDTVTVYRDSVSKTITSAGIDNTPVKGASVTLPAGYAYLIIGQWTFNTGSSSASRNNQVVIKDMDAGVNKATNRIYYTNQSFAVMQVAYVTDTLTSNTEFAVCGSSSMSYTNASNTTIMAIPIQQSIVIEPSEISENTFKYTTTIDTDSAPENNEYLSGFEIDDVDGNNITYVGLNNYSSGRLGAQFKIHRNVDGTDIYHGIEPYIDDDGTTGYTIDNNTAFNQALNIHIEEKTSASTSINANTTSWVNVSKPSNSTPIAVVGYYVNGAQQISVYNMTMDENGTGSFAIRNNSSSKATFTLKVQFLCI